jgi:hypothetical protein
MKNTYVLYALSYGIFCCASENSTSKKFDAIAIMLENDENKIHENFAKIVTDTDKQDNQKKFGRGSSTHVINLERDGKYVMTANGIVKLPLPDNRRFGRGSSGPGEGSDWNAKL